MRIVITGAAGLIGREVVEELSRGHELILLDRRPRENLPIHVADLGWPGPWMRLLGGANCVIHLAASPAPEGRAYRLVKANLLAPVWIVTASLWYGIPRIVFASSGWVVRAVEDALAPACYESGGPKIDAHAFGPRTLYGWSKAWGELVGRVFTRLNDSAAFLSVRIGWFGSDVEKDERGRRVWLGSSDVRAFFRRAVEAQYAGNVVAYATSAQESTPYDLRDSESVLGWRPRQLPPSIASA